MSEATTPIIGIMLGDASGCGPEIIAKLAASGKLSEEMRPILIGDTRVFANAQKYTNTKVPTTIIESPDQADWSNGSIPFIDMKNLDPSTFPLGTPNAECGRAVGEAFTYAIPACMKGDFDGVLYAPIHKQALFMGGFKFDSEAEMFASLLKTDSYYCEINILGDVWTTRVTSHIPLMEVGKWLTKERIVEAIVFGNRILKQAGYAEPRLAVTALNPHSGENGKCGREEIDIIAPAVAEAAAKGIDIRGPFPADTVFNRAFKGEFDMVVTLYHDQGQIALKTKGFSEGVTVAGGFPIPIVTPAHGTAFGKVGKGTVDTTATERALGVCRRMSLQNRRERGKA